MNTKTYRQGVAGYIIFIPLIAVCIYFLISAFFLGYKTTTFYILAAFGFGIYFLVMLIDYARTKIIVDDFSISYNTMLKQNRLTFGEIVKIEAYAKLEGITHYGGIHGKYMLALHTHSDKIEIKIKAYRRKSLTELAKLLISKCPKADINEQTYLMTKGKMPSMFLKYQ